MAEVKLKIWDYLFPLPRMFWMSTVVLAKLILRIIKIQGFILALVFFVNTVVFAKISQGFASLVDKLGAIKAAAPAGSSAMGNMSAVSLIERLEVANAIFPVDHLLTCIFFFFAAWVLALEVKFVFFVIRLVKPF